MAYCCALEDVRGLYMRVLAGGRKGDCRDVHVSLGKEGCRIDHLPCKTQS